jgi:scyllo-inositol 2-dehydrogenase (NADP+)
MQTINVALCSFGMSGWVFHAPFIHAHPGFGLYAVYERSKNLANEKYPGTKTYRSLDEMLADENVRLVIVNTPNATHYEFAKKALQAGKHVVVEKPFTIEVEEAEELIALAKKQDKVLSVYQNRRWDSDFLTVKKVLDQKLLGDIAEAEIHFDRYKEELSPKLHKETPGPGTGALYDLGSHLIDQAIQLFGMPRAVFADIAIMRAISQVDDYFEVLFYYPNLRVRLKGTYIARETVPSYIIHGTKGSFLKSRADIQETDLQSMKIPGNNDWGKEPVSQKGLLHTEYNGKLIKEYVDTEQGNYMHYYDGLYAAITSGKTPAVTGEDGLKVIQVIKAAIKSNDEKRIIDIIE